MIIELKNCNSIDFGRVKVVENALNIFYAINGTGKSTIAKALAALGNQSTLEALRPFKYLNSTDETHKPYVSGMENIQSIGVFNEQYVSQYVFKTDEIIQNSFEIFIKTPNYEQQLQDINDLIKETKIIFAQNPKLDELISDFTVFVDGFGKAQSGYSAAGSLGKGLGSGNKVHNIPEGLTPFKDYIQNSENGINAKWLKWHLSGNEFVDIAHQCPYCASGASDETKATILKVSEEFDPKAIEHLNKMLDVFNKLKNYFSDATNQKIDEIAKSISGISSEQKTYLLEIKQQVVTLKDKLWKIKTLGFTSLKDVDKVVNELSSYRIELSYLGHLDSTYSREKISLINTVLDIILVKATDLQVAVGKQKSSIKKTINEYSSEINSFLKYAGYSYAIVLEDDNQGSYKLKLRHSDISTNISNADSHLSFGERNAFALVLFMYQTLKSNPDIIVLDDPISSFDGNKKYAILYKLFKEKRSFKGKTVILLTHEFGTIIDTIYNMPGTITAT
ncbi:MAG: AAA family ATPase, partial [Oscillospiraceae bacterium]